MSGFFLVGLGGALWLLGIGLAVALAVLAMVALWRGWQRTAVTSVVLIAAIFFGLVAAPAFA